MKKTFLLFCFLSFAILLSAQNDSIFRIDSLPKVFGNSHETHYLQLIKSWKYHKGDDTLWANLDYNDKSWQFVLPELNLDSLPEKTFENIGWFRIHLEIDSSLLDKTLGLIITQSGASEIYLDGKRIHSFGKIDVENTLNEERFDPQEIPFDIRFEKTKKHVLVVRYANSKAESNFQNNVKHKAGFSMKIGNLNENILSKYIQSNIETSLFIFYFTFFIALSFLHFMFFVFYRENKSNLYYSIFAGAFGTVFLFITIQKAFLMPDVISLTLRLQSFLADFYMPSLLAMLYTIFNKKLPKLFWFWFSLFAIDFILVILNIEINYFGTILSIIFATESLRIIVTAIIKKREGSWIIGTGIISTLTFFISFVIFAYFKGRDFNFSGKSGLILGLVALYATLSIPLSMTIYLALDFAKTSKKLEKKLIEVETLSAKTILQEKEKQKILETQKETLEIQVKERTSEIVEQKKVIEKKNKDITDSISYAKTIQEAILPSKELKYKLFPDSFILFKPKDIVSGDFYWYTEVEGRTESGERRKSPDSRLKIIAACDCTGHGVPGALMSMIGNNILNQIVNEKGITSPADILNYLHKEIRKTLNQEEQNETKDGMDIAIVTFNSETEIEFAGAQRPLWVVRSLESGEGRTENTEREKKEKNSSLSIEQTTAEGAHPSTLRSPNSQLTQIKGDKFAIGGLQDEAERKFTNHKISVSKGDCIYISTDGFADQFSDIDNKLMTSRFKELLISIQEKSMPEQEMFLADFIEKWRGNREQIDDILVIGIRI